MSKKIILSILFLVLLKSEKVFSQSNRDAVINGYMSMYEYLYFDSLNKLSNHQLSDFKNSYTFYLTFKIDTTATVIDLEIIEIPGAELPSFIKIYMEKLVKSTNGRWLPQIKDSKKVISDEMMYQVGLVKRDQSLEDRDRDNKPIIEYFLFGTQKRVDKIEKIVYSQKKRLIPLSY